MAEKKFLNKEEVKNRIDDLKLLISQSEATAKNNARYRKTIDRLVSQFVTKKDEGRKVQFLFGESEEVREGILVRAPSEGHPNFTVAVEDPKSTDGKPKRVPRTASMFVGFVN